MLTIQKCKYSYICHLVIYIFLSLINAISKFKPIPIACDSFFCFCFLKYMSFLMTQKFCGSILAHRIKFGTWNILGANTHPLN